MVRALQDYVTRQAERRPEAIALVHGDQRVTYGELERRANRLARLLREHGARSDRIGLLLPKSPAAIVGMLATLKAGAIYVPLDPESPAARLEKILRAAECRHLLAAASAAPLLRQLMTRLEPGLRPDLVWMEGAAPAGAADLAARFTEGDAAAMSAEPLPDGGAGDDPAHLLFTSGSTGTPKGVIVAHRNVIAFVSWANEHFGINETDRVSCHSPLAFDLSTYDLFGGLAAGAEIHLVPPQLNLFPGRLTEFIREHRLTQWFSVPSILAYLARFDAVQWGDFPELKRLIWCGEVFATPALRYWMERVPHASFTNLYGPTETTIASSYFTVEAPPDPSAGVPIGRACRGETLHILGADLQPLPPGEVGEIGIGGAGVTLGYWRDADRTSAAFVSLPTEPGAKVYRTGDLGMRDVAGLVHFLGRKDSQIKSRGHRIELGEIEAALNTVPEIGEGVVVALPPEGFGGHTICCAYVPRNGSELSPAAARERLAALVPKYMLPARWRAMDRLPANANGKVDRVALRDMFGEEMAGEPAP
jgi:amino acid adenylation domain-containing protein